MTAELLSGRRWKTLLDEQIDMEKHFMGGLGPFERWKMRDSVTEKMRQAFDFVNLGMAKPYNGRIIPVMRGGASSPFASVVGQPAAAPSAFTAVNTTNVETNLWTPAIWSPIPANDMVAGKVYQHFCGGILGTSSAAPTSTWTPRVGQSATPASNITMGASTGTTMIASLSAVPWNSQFIFKISALGLAASGVSGTGNGHVIIGGITTAAGIVQSIGSTLATTIDSTAATGYILSQTWGTNAAANTVQAQIVTPVLSWN